jgi:Uma2 family endonuclease
MATGTSSASVVQSSRKVPPLCEGERLSREEFERRYAAMPHLKKAELIEGVVHMAPPAVRWDFHARPDVLIAGWLMVYEAGTPGVQTGHNASLRLGIENEPQPDSVLLIEPRCGGRVRFSSDNYVEGPPEFVAEISASTLARDLDKRQVYLNTGVSEYLIWRVEERVIDWLSARDGAYVPLDPDQHGIAKSQTFPGLWLDVPSMLRLDSAAVLRAVQKGLASAEHAAFVANLALRK